MFPSSSFQQNLRLPESGLSFSLNILLAKSDFLILLNPIDFSTSANLLLLKIYDKCDITRGQISFIPLDFLEKYYIKNNLGPKILLEDKNKLNKKKNILKYFFDKQIFTKSFYIQNKYKGIPLEYFRKYILNADLTKTKDFCQIKADYETLDVLSLNKTRMINPRTEINRNKKEWMCVYDLINFLKSYIGLLTDEEKKNDFLFLNFLFLPVEYDRNDIYTFLLNNFQIDNIKKRFICFIILHSCHFTSVIIDLKVNIHDSDKRVAFFFNSCGYIPLDFKLNKDFWFIDSSFKIINHKAYPGEKKESYNNISIHVLCEYLSSKLGITNFVFNTFSIQNFDSECGIFSSFFIFLFLNIIQKKNLSNININTYKCLYFNISALGGDLIYSMLRGLIFFTKYDLIKHEINEDEYYTSPFVYDIINKKYKEYIKVYYKNIDSIKNKIMLRVEEEYNALHSLQSSQ